MAEVEPTLNEQQLGPESTGQLKFVEIQNGEHIGLCQSMLENRMQCPKAGKYNVFDERVVPPRALGQHCGRHAAMIEAEMIQVQSQVNPTPLPEEGGAVNGDEPAQSSAGAA